MRRLLLLRHAKSSWGTPGIKDFDRPLAPRGIAAAARMGRYLTDNDLVPDLVLCSPAERTRQTVTLVLEAAGEQPEVRFEEALYHEGKAAMLSLLAAVDAGIGTVMIIGHNPTIAECAFNLAAPGAAGLRTAISTKFPTAALAVLEFPGNEWASVEPGSAELKAFVKPRALAE